MKVWHVLADDCEALVVDETPARARAQLGRPNAEVWEQKPNTETFGIPVIIIPGVELPFFVAGLNEPLMLWRRNLEA